MSGFTCRRISFYSHSCFLELHTATLSPSPCQSAVFSLRIATERLNFVSIFAVHTHFCHAAASLRVNLLHFRPDLTRYRLFSCQFPPLSVILVAFTEGWLSSLGPPAVLVRGNSWGLAAREQQQKIVVPPQFDMQAREPSFRPERLSYCNAGLWG